MTRETKIGLLVGLAFIIVIGILLSDHINNSTDPAPAAMGQTYSSVQRSVETPDARDAGVTTVVTPPHAVIPQTPVQTMRDPQPVVNGGSVVVIGPGKDPSSLPRQTRGATVEPQPDGTGVQVVSPGNTELAGNENPNAAMPASAGNGVVAGPLSAVARDNGEELTTLNGAPVHLNPNANATNTAALGPVAARPQAALPPGVRQVKAEEGDTVSKLAVKYMGGNTKANREAIIRANPKVGPEGSRVIAGQNYLIPVATASATSQAPAPVVVTSDQMQPTPAPKPAAPRMAPALEPLPAGVTLYTVKENESLWKIASEQLGSGARYAEIRDLNPDVLKGSDAVRPGMRLKLPPKAVAASN